MYVIHCWLEAFQTVTAVAPVVLWARAEALVAVVTDQPMLDHPEASGTPRMDAVKFPQRVRVVLAETSIHTAFPADTVVEPFPEFPGSE